MDSLHKGAEAWRRRGLDWPRAGQTAVTCSLASVQPFNPQTSVWLVVWAGLAWPGRTHWRPVRQVDGTTDGRPGGQLNSAISQFHTTPWQYKFSLHSYCNSCRLYISSLWWAHYILNQQGNHRYDILVYCWDAFIPVSVYNSHFPTEEYAGHVLLGSDLAWPLHRPRQADRLQPVVQTAAAGRLSSTAERRLNYRPDIIAQYLILSARQADGGRTVGGLSLCQLCSACTVAVQTFIFPPPTCPFPVEKRWESPGRRREGGRGHI